MSGWKQRTLRILSRLMRLYGKPAFVRSDNGAEFTAAKVMRWLRDAAIGPAFREAALRPVGETILRAVEDTRRLVSANTNLGLVLLLAPDPYEGLTPQHLDLIDAFLASVVDGEAAAL